ncbi:hypothetical protein E6H27_06975 [Candidatus Bathyarchaeota archaeon]|nr:MAG: hypothetical protein E6H27_06975 [Candidatus Bathyarchaeota archaeon]
MIGVYIQGSDVMNGFGVTLLADNTLLKPADVDLTGTVLSRVAAPTVVAECIAGLSKIGTCDPTTDTADTIHFAVAVLSGTTTSPTTGLLFTAIYNITGTSPAGGIPVDFQTGCGSSTSVPGGVCVTIVNGSPPPNAVDPETAQAGSFDNSTPPPWLSISSSTTTIGPIIGGGVSGTATITTTAQNGWPPASGSDSISFTTKQTSGLTASLSGGGSCAPAACSITLTVSAAAGNYTVTVFGKYSTIDAGSTLTSTLVAPVTLSVMVEDYSITVSSTTVNIPPNGATYGAATVTVTSLNRFSGPVTVSTSAVAPVGLTVSYSPSTFTLTAGGAEVTTISLSSTTMNRYLLTVKAVSGSLTRATPVVRVFADSFTVTANPSTFSFNAGDPASTILTLQSYPIGNTNSGFAGTVTLTNSTALGLGPNSPCPATATLTAGASTTVTCNFNSLKAGTYSMTITGSGGFNGAIINSTTLTITVIPVFGLSANPASLNVNATVAGTSTITASDQGGFSGTVDLSYNVSPNSGLTCTFTPTSIAVPSGGSGTSTLSCTGTAIGTYTVTVTGTAVGLTPKTVTVTYTVQDFSVAADPASPDPVLAGATTTSTIHVLPLNGFTGTVTLSVSASTPAGATCSLSVTSQHLGPSFTSYLTCQASAAGDYTVTVTGTSGSLTHTTSAVTFTVETFTIAASSPALVNVGASGTSTITVTGANGPPQTVSLSVSASTPAGLTCNLASSVTVPPTATPALSCTALVAGDYSVVVTGTFGSESHSTATIAFRMADFAIVAGSVTPSSINIGSTGTSTVTLTRINSFSDSVSLSTSVTPSTGLSASCSPQTLTGSVSSTCTLSASASGSYTVTITGADGSLSHYAALTVTVAAADFSLSASPTSVTFAAGVTGSITTVTLTPLNGFAGTVSFGAFVSPSVTPGLDVNCAPQTITGGTTSVCHFSSQSPGTYTVTIRGTSGTLSHEVTVNVTVNPVSQTSILGLDPLTFYAIVGVAVVAVAGASLVAIRRRASARQAKKPPTGFQNRGVVPGKSSR